MWFVFDFVPLPFCWTENSTGLQCLPMKFAFFVFAASVLVACHALTSPEMFNEKLPSREELARLFPPMVLPIPEELHSKPWYQAYNATLSLKSKFEVSAGRCGQPGGYCPPFPACEPGTCH